MSLVARIEQLESELFQVRKILHHKDENQHEVWNDMQDKIREKLDKTYLLVEELSVSNAEIKARLEKQRSHLVALETRMLVLENDVSTMKTEMSIMKTDISDLKGMVQQLLDRQ